jgi:hypothetical protein
VEQALKRFDRADVGIQAQLLTHSEQPLLGTHFGIGVEVKLEVAHRGKEHSIRICANAISFVGKRIAHGIDGGSAYKGRCEAHVVAKLRGDSLDDCYALLRDFGSYAVAGEHCYMEFHRILREFLEGYTDGLLVRRCS